MSPKISVLMPVYNAENYLLQAVESICSQSYKDFEFIIIDDGSSDGSLEILRKFSENDNRIKLHSRPNKGLISTLNEGLSYCKGEYIARMDADDISLPNRLGAQVEYMQNHPDCVAVGSGVLLIDPEGEVLCSYPLLLTHQEIDNANLSLIGGSAIVHPSVMFRSSIIVGIGGYRGKYLHAEDIDLFLRLAEVGEIANINNNLLKYRMHLDSVGYSQRKLQIEGIYNAVVDACKRRKWVIPKYNSRGHSETQSFASVYRKWAWWALNAGNIKVSRKHAWRAFCQSPLSKKNLIALICALRGY